MKAVYKIRLRVEEEQMNNREYQICKSCVMDTSDSLIVFDEHGVCEYCNNFKTNILPNWHPDEESARQLSDIVDAIKTYGRGKKYDCLIGLSGGVDSSYLAYYAKEKLGLRPLLFAVDTGWNDPVAIQNIQAIASGLKCDVHNEVIDFATMADLQLAFFKSQVAHQDTPQDHAIFAALYQFARKEGFRYILTGANYSTECVREPLEWCYHGSDIRQIKDIHKKYGKGSLNRFPLVSVYQKKIFDRYIRNIKLIDVLNYIPYCKKNVITELSERFGWQEYPNKHYESVFTRFFEGYWLPKKFGFDKRKAHFSSMILTGQMTREEALRILEQPPYSEDRAMKDMACIIDKLGITKRQFEDMMAQPNKTYKDYKNEMMYIKVGTKIMQLFGKERKVMR